MLGETNIADVRETQIMSGHVKCGKLSFLVDFITNDCTLCVGWITKNNKGCQTLNQLTNE